MWEGKLSFLVSSRLLLLKEKTRVHSQLLMVLHLSSAGLGDRIRAMMETVKLARYSERAVLFEWANPADITVALQPANELDWRLKQEYKLQDKRSISYVWSTWIPWSSESKGPPEILDGSFAAEQSKVISISSNFLDQK